MDIERTEIPGCYVLQARVLGDRRGSFVKTFHAPRFQELGLRTDWKEEYFSLSAKGVVRGMHFQLPPADHAKMVFCLTGEVLDVVVDLRRGSPAYRKATAFMLSAENGRAVYIPTGCAHGFLSRTDGTGLYYKVTSVHAPENDRGIAWNSIDFDWPTHDPFLSDRDRGHPTLSNFDSPFVFDHDRAAR
jgi:dTDP-4-dehydrorhamnose 3,5-epimerase